MTASPRPFASVIVTVGREAPDRLERLARRIAAQSVPGSLQIIVAAPPGEFATIQTAWRRAAPGANLVLVANPTGHRAVGLNLAAEAAAGDVLVRLDACSGPADDYVKRCVERLRRDKKVGVVGGRQVPVPGDQTVMARGIARALANPWALGGAAYRRAGAGGSVDTVYLGAFRRDELLELRYNEAFHTNQDFELCTRYRAAGFVVWLEEGVDVQYEARTSIRGVWRQYEAFGVAKAAYWRRRREGPNTRQLVALVLAVFGFVSAAVLLRRRPTRLVAAVAIGTGAVATFDHVIEPGERDVRVRAVALTGYGACWLGWLTGIAKGLFAAM